LPRVLAAPALRGRPASGKVAATVGARSPAAAAVPVARDPG